MKQKVPLFILVFGAIGILTAAGILLAARVFNRTSIDADQVLTEMSAPDGEAYWQITAGPANGWLLPLEDGYFLIDTGYPEDYDRFIAGLRDAGIDPHDIEYLFVTHAHDEHAGFAAQLAKDSDAILVLPEASLPVLESGQFLWQGVSVNRAVHTLAAIYNFVTSRDFRFDPVLPSSEDVILRGLQDDICREWGLEGSFLYTPGHSSDSWSLVLDDGRAFVGDAAMNTLLFLGTNYRPLFMEHRRQVYQSMDRIRSSGAQTILSGHGGPFLAELLPVYRAETGSGPGISALPAYFVRLVPGLALIILLLLIGRKGSLAYRVWFYIIAFILMRDLMTPFGFWTLGTDPVFWMRFAADGLLLFVLAGGSLGIGFAIVLYERRQGTHLPWFKGSRVKSLLGGVAGLLIVTLPVLLSYRGILPGERGGLFPRSLVPAVFAVALAGNFLEELLFRGYLQSWFLEQGIAPVGSAIASGITFGLCHVFLAYTVTDVGVGILLFSTWEGLVCGLLRHRFGLASAVVTHSLAVAVLAIA